MAPPTIPRLAPITAPATPPEAPLNAPTANPPKNYEHSLASYHHIRSLVLFLLTYQIYFPL